MAIYWEKICENDFVIPEESLDVLLEPIVGENDVNVILCDNDFIQKLNKEYRGKDYPTDVISFAMQEGEYAEFSGNMLGDIYISFDKVIEQAKEYYETIEEEFVRLLIHGIFHLLGYDHIDEDDRVVMERKEIELFNKFYEKESDV